MTRWHPDDLGGRILESGDTWRILRLPALAEAEDPIGRALGEPLWPEWESAEDLSRKRAMIGERAFSSLFQQNPRLQTGRLFLPARVTILTEPAPGTQTFAKTVRAWDLAATAEDTGRDADYTVGLKLACDTAGQFIVLDVIRLRGGPHEVVAAITATAAADGTGVTIGLPQDPGQAGRAQISYLANQLVGYRIVATPETGPKETRAMPVASQVNAGNLALRSAPWNRVFLEELQDFPNGAKDDQVDALSRAFAVLLDAAAPARRASVSHFNR
jgi:predicted phage terminase large subunit-like protein